MIHRRLQVTQVATARKSLPARSGYTMLCFHYYFKISYDSRLILLVRVIHMSFRPANPFSRGSCCVILNKNNTLSTIIIIQWIFFLMTWLFDAK
jgi:hypothetical protein